MKYYMGVLGVIISACCSFVKAESGLDFTVESGVRVSVASNPKAGVDSSGSIYLYYFEGFIGGKDLLSISTDGLTFPTGATYTTYKNDARNTLMPDGTYRRYTRTSPSATSFSSLTSTDGITFTAEAGTTYTINAVDKGTAGVYDAYKQANGNVIFLYLGDLMGLNNTRMARSTDGGKTFTFVKTNVLGDDAAGGGSNAFVDIFTVKLPDGRRRLFTMKGGIAIYSFISSDDGETYTQEAGTRVSRTDFKDFNVTGLFDPCVVLLPDGRYRMYVCANILNADSTTTSAIVSAVTSAPTAPAITSSLTASGTAGTAFSYTITATGSTPITYTATPLPAGLTLSGAVLSGTPTTAGVYNVVLGASNGTLPNSSKTLVLTVDPADPAITSMKITPSPAKVGQTVNAVGAATTSGTEPITYSWDFGDGSDAVDAATATHVYTTDGTYTITLTATAGIDFTTQTVSLIVNPLKTDSTLKATLTLKDSYAFKDVVSKVDGPTEVDTSTLSISAKISMPAGAKLSGTDSISINAGGYSFSKTLSGANKIKVGQSYTFSQTDTDRNGKVVKTGSVVVSLSKGVLTVTVSLKGNSTYTGGTTSIVAADSFGTTGAVTGQVPVSISLGSLAADFNASYSGKASDKPDKNGIDVGSVSVSGGDTKGVVSY